MYYLGVDWGKSKCGIAIADKEILIATSYKKVSSKEIVKEIKSFANENKIEKIVVGVHQDLIGKKDFENFLEQVKTSRIQLVLEDEKFSTKMAQKNIMDFKKKNLAQIDDKESARIILQSWLDKEK